MTLRQQLLNLVDALDREGTIAFAVVSLDKNGKFYISGQADMPENCRQVIRKLRITEDESHAEIVSLN